MFRGKLQCLPEEVYFLVLDHLDVRSLMLFHSTTRQLRSQLPHKAPCSALLYDGYVKGCCKAYIAAHEILVRGTQGHVKFDITCYPTVRRSLKTKGDAERLLDDLDHVETFILDETVSAFSHQSVALWRVPQDVEHAIGSRVKSNGIRWYRSDRRKMDAWVITEFCEPSATEGLLGYQSISRGRALRGAPMTIFG